MKTTISGFPVCGLVLAAAGLLMGQQSSLNGPIAGYVFDAGARGLRPVQGIPGAALLGDPVNFGFDLSAVYVAPGQDSAVVVGADGSLHLFKLNAGSVSEVGLGGLAGVPQAVVFSPSGTAAALFAAGHVRILSGLPGAPMLAGAINIPDFGTRKAPAPGQKANPAGGVDGNLAVSDDGAYLLAVSGVSVQTLGVHGDQRVLLPAQSDSHVAFAPGGHDAAVVDSVAGVTLIRDAAGTGTPQSLAAADAGLASPAGLAFSRDRQTLYVASASAQSVAAFSLSSGSRTTIACACAPSTLTPMGPLFQLNQIGAAPLWILDTGATTPRTVFVPARGE